MTCDGKSAADADGGAASCPYAGKPMDVSRYPVCKGTGRCVKESVIDTVAPEAKSRLAPCDDGLCVPEEILAAYGQYLPASCTSIAGIEGRCISTVLPEVETNEDILPKDTCRETERCIPCYSATGADTGACKTVKCDAPKTPPPVFSECCKIDGAMRGKCLPRKDIPGSIQSRLEAHECASADLCVPNENVDPRVKPATCTSMASGKGICVSECVSVSTVGSILLTRGSCSEAQKCVPCSAARGMPGCE
jgi:hypothetical protein